MIFRKATKLTLMTGTLITILGFTDFFLKNDVYDQTKSFISQVHSTSHPNPELTGLETQELTPYVPYRYVNENIDPKENNPFAVKFFVREIGQDQLGADANTCDGDDCGDGPPEIHTPFFLESYSIDQLAMTGSMTSSAKGKVALIQTPDAGIVYTTVGEYIGRNNGLILSINREGIIIREKYRSPQGWQDRMATLPLIRN